MIEVVLTNILVQGGVIYPYINGFLCGSCLPLVLSSYDVEIVEVWYSLEQYIGFEGRQAFIHYCGLHQV